MKKILCVLLAGCILLSLCACGGSAFSDNPSRQTGSGGENISSSKDGAVQDTVDADSVDAAIDSIIQSYCDEDGYIERDEQKLSESSKLVYEYAEKLKENGDIEDCTYCEESGVVAFYFDEETVSLYIPRIRQTMSGDNGCEFTVTAVETIDWLSDAVITGLDQLSQFRITGSQESAKLIYDSMEEYTKLEDFNRDNWHSMEDVVAWMHSLSENRVRVILWRGHGSKFMTNTGEELAVWVLPVKRNEENDKYKNKDNSFLSTDKYCAISSTFWEKYCDTIDGGLFLSGSCHTGADGGRAALTFFNKGFSAYAAPNGGIWTTYSDKMMGRIVEYLCGNVDGVEYNIDDAMKKAKEDVGEKDIYGVSMVHANADPADPFMLVPPGDAAPLKSSNMGYYRDVIYKTRGALEAEGISLSALPVEPPKYKYICSFLFYQDRLYFCCKESGTSDFASALYSCNPDGSDMTLLREDLTNFIIYNGRLYNANLQEYYDIKTGTWKQDTESLAAQWSGGGSTWETDEFYFTNTESEGLSCFTVVREEDGTKSYTEKKVLVPLDNPSRCDIQTVAEGKVFFTYWTNALCMLYCCDIETGEVTLLDERIAAGSGEYFGW